MSENSARAQGSGNGGGEEPRIGVFICHCGECSDTCPREAEPGEFMAAARRYAISHNDPTGLSRLLYISPAANLVAFAAVAALLAFFLLHNAGPISGRFFEFIPGKTIHDVGIVVGLVALAVMLVGAIRMARGVVASPEFGNGLASAEGHGTRPVRGIGAVLMEVFAQERYRECASEQTSPWYLSRWFAHWAISWGFMGLLFATTWDYLDTLPDGTLVPLYYPPRLVGTIAGLLFLYGTGTAPWQRLTGMTKYAKDSAVSDWVLISYLFLLAVTGFVLEVLVYDWDGVGNVWSGLASRSEGKDTWCRDLQQMVSMADILRHPLESWTGGSILIMCLTLPGL